MDHGHFPYPPDAANSTVLALLYDLNPSRGGEYNGKIGQDESSFNTTK